MTLNELFTAITTSRIDVQSMIENSTDNEATFKHLMWHIPTGMRYTLDDEMKENISEFINEVATQLNVDKNEIFNEDGLLTDIEIIGGGSKIEIDVDETNDSKDGDDSAE